MSKEKRTAPPCDRNCFECEYPDCVWDGMEYEDYRESSLLDRELKATFASSKCAARQRAYRQAHKEERAAYQRAYYQAHKEEIAARKRAYWQAHKEEIATRQRAYRRAKAAGRGRKEIEAAQAQAREKAPEGGCADYNRPERE